MQSATATDKDEVKEASTANGDSEQHLASTVDPPADKLAQTDIEEEEDVPKKEQVALWRRNKMSDKERYEDVFTFEVNGRSMTIHQDMANELATVGLTVWDASLVLLKYLEKLHKEEKFLSGAKVLELGCGCGALSIGTAYLGANVVATDVNYIIPLTSRNVEENKSAMQGSVEVKELLWGRESDYQGLPSFDYILAADCIYKEKQVIKFLKTVHEIANDETQIFFAFEQHNPESTREFWKHVRSFFDTESITLNRLDGIYQHPKIKVMKLRRKEFVPPPTPLGPLTWTAGVLTDSQRENQTAKRYDS